MPFGLQLKSVIVGIVLALFVYPFVMQLIAGLTHKGTTKPAGRTV